MQWEEEEEEVGFGVDRSDARRVSIINWVGVVMGVREQKRLIRANPLPSSTLTMASSDLNKFEKSHSFRRRSHTHTHPMD